MIHRSNSYDNDAADVDDSDVDNEGDGTSMGPATIDTVRPWYLHILTLQQHRALKLNCCNAVMLVCRNSRMHCSTKKIHHTVVHWCHQACEIAILSCYVV